MIVLAKVEFQVPEEQKLTKINPRTGEVVDNVKTTVDQDYKFTAYLELSDTDSSTTISNKIIEYIKRGHPEAKNFKVKKFERIQTLKL